MEATAKSPILRSLESPPDSPECESFVVIASGSDFENFMDENEIVENSLLQENKQLLQDELEGVASASKGIIPNQMEPMAINENNDDLVSIASFSRNDFRSQEIQENVEKLVVENLRLKEMIIQNNKLMKEQYQKIVAWQEDVERAHQKQKQQFLDAKERLEAFKQENASYKKQISELQLKSVKDENMLKLQLETSQAKFAQFEEELNKAGNHQEIETLKEQLEKVEKENEKLRNELQKTTDFDEIQMQMQNKLQELEKELQEVYKELKLKQDEQIEIKSKLRQTSTENDRLKLDMESHHEKANDDIKTSASQIEQLQSKYQSAMKEIEKLKESEEASKIEAWRARQKVAELEQRNPNFNIEIKELQEQKQTLQMALTQSEQNRTVAEAQLKAMKNVNADLRTSLQEKGQYDKDYVGALEQQLEVYKQDFEAEQKINEELKLEKRKIAEDLQLLHRRNQQLQEEIEGVRRVPSAPRQSQSPQAARYSCPLCGTIFRSLKIVQEHVDNCDGREEW